MDNCVRENKPEFLELLESMRGQLDMLDENSSIIFQKVNTIKDITEPELEKANAVDEQSQAGVLGELWKCVSLLRGYNESLERSKKGLIRFVG